MRYFLDEREVDAPAGLDGLTLRKGINRRYWGLIRRKLGYTEGLSDVQFEQMEAVQLLQLQLRTHGVQAKTRFRIVAGSGTALYDGFIDYSTYAWDGTAVSVMLTDDQSVVSLETGAATTFSVNPSNSISLHARRLGGVVQLLTDPNTLVIQRSTKDPSTVSHAIPLTRKNEKEDTVTGVLAPVVTPLALDPCYRNTTGSDVFVKLNGVVSVSAIAGASATVRLLATALTAGGQVAYEVAIGQYGIGSSATLIRALLDIRIQVPPGGSLRVWWSSVTPITSFAFTYTAPDQPGATLVSITDESDSSRTVASGLLMVDALAQLVSQATKGALLFRSHFFEEGDGAGLFLLSGSGVRGLSTPIATTLQTLFDGLTRIYNLSLWADEVGTVWLEPRSARPKRKTIIRQVFSYRQQVATEFLYSQISIGYDTWQGTSLLAGEETHGSRSYSTGITALGSELDLRSQFIAASTLIEEQRRKQLDPKTAGSGKVEGLDGRLFVVQGVKTATGWKAETTENAGYTTGVTEPETLYNRRITPRRNLERWLPQLSGSYPLRLEAVQGSVNLISTYRSATISEGMNPTTADRTLPLLATVEVPMGMDEFGALGELIQIDAPGLTVEGELLDAQWRQSASGDTATLQLLING